MKTITVSTDIYKFSELPVESQQKALEKLYDINVGYEWWEFIYEDATNVGFIIKGFDEAYYIEKSMFKDSHERTADRILENHGETSDTFKAAAEFLKERDALVEKLSNGLDKNRVTEDNNDEFDACIGDLEYEFQQSLESSYREILRKEYEYLISNEAIIESIEANDYDFTIDGKIF